MIKRIITTLIGLPILVAIILLGNMYLLVALFIVSLLCLKEFYAAVQSTELKLMMNIGCLFSFLFYTSLYYTLDISNALPLLILTTISMLSIQVISNYTYSIVDIGIVLFSIIYIPLTISHLFLIERLLLPHSIWLVFIIAWCCDTFAYFTGLAIGKHKLCPSISPKKTIEGAFGGIVGSMVGCFLFSYFVMPEYICVYTIMGLVGAFLSQLGDLSASIIKRFFSIKDFGNIFPGHGGVLDRFDSILFTAPFVFYYLQLINQVIS
ncbi:phosphatidate cytidylyltransferase [Tindallia magadiensis]|uniref:Phosphatidate cytidylyltransferase n=1 Tax=Tindallia magadiensis TaxID=69895 RepID=A0A1I3AHN2_9FIRM|nr:phosphatidate cytidylyltransferase [Tindallia magadiensis]SFH49555.1 phosphatidate cytidylyltransferase [Tindallia magadiensis]